MFCSYKVEALYKNIAKRCSSGILLFITVFESRNWDVCDNILVLLHRLLEIYDCLVTRYSEVYSVSPCPSVALPGILELLCIG